MDAMLKAKIMELAATAQVIGLKAERGQFWDDREARNECARLANMANEIASMAARK